MSLNFAGLVGETRTERLKFILKLDRTQVEGHLDDVKTVHGGPVPPVGEGDLLTLNYEVYCRYFGDVERRLAALGRLLDAPGMVHEVSLEELRHGHCLFAGIVKQIEALQAKLNP